MNGAYRNEAEAPRPVCAACLHRRDARVMEKEQPWRDWRCTATAKVVRDEQYNPITGVTTPAIVGAELCIDMNDRGQCTAFEPLPKSDPYSGSISARIRRAFNLVGLT